MLLLGKTVWDGSLKRPSLSLQLDQIPQGSFTYRDPYKRYTLSEAMDIMNGLLLTRGLP